MENRILLISPSYPPPLMGGHKVYMYNIIENLPVDVDILTSDLKAGWTDIVSSRHRVIRSKRIFSGKSEDINPTAWNLFVSYLWMMNWFVNNITKNRYDLVIVNAFNFANGFFFLLGKILKVPVIGVGYSEEFTLCLYGKGLKNTVKRKWTGLTHKSATGFVVVCDFCKSVLEKFGVDPKRIAIVPPSINPVKLDQETPRKVSGTPRILSVGRLVERKGFHHLIEAFSTLKDEFPGLQLTIVGNGPYKSKIEHLIEERGLQKVIHLRSWVSDKDLAALYAQSTLFVLANSMLPNGDTEGCPTVFLEASSRGLPVIGGTGGGSDTAIRDGETGHIVNANDQNQLIDRMRRILSDKTLAQKMSEAGMTKIQEEHLPQITGPLFYRSIQQMIKKA